VLSPVAPHSIVEEKTWRKLVALSDAKS